MAWRPFVQLVTKYALPFHLNRSELSAECWETDSIIYFLAADDEKTVGRLRGIPGLYRCRIDECQRYSDAVLQEMIDAVRPGLRPRKGCLWLLGTGSDPNIRTVWCGIRTNDAYSHFKFTYLDNDKLGQTREEAEAIVDEDLRAAKKTRDSAWFKQEYLAEDVADIEIRVYKFSAARNTYRVAPHDLDTFAICGDTGVKDADALELLGWRSDGPRKVYLLREHAKRGQDVDDLDRVLTEWLTTYSPIIVVIDAGANAKTVLTLQRRHVNVPITPATKPTVNQQVEELNAFLTDGILLVPEESQFAAEVVKPTWEGGIRNGKILEHGHSDVVPSMRYGCIAIRTLIPDSTDAPKDEEERKQAERLERIRKAQRKHRRPKWDQQNSEHDEPLEFDAEAMLGDDVVDE
jgi:hypothetical protein